MFIKADDDDDDDDYDDDHHHHLDHLDHHLDYRLSRICMQLLHNKPNVGVWIDEASFGVI